MTDRKTVFVEGTIFWAKIIGEPRPNYDGDAREWTYDFVPDDITFLKDAKLLDRLKEAREPITGDYLRLKKPEFDKDGNRNEPIRIYDEKNDAWEKDKLLGNGTRVVVKLSIIDWGKGKKQSIYTQAIRVEKHVPYMTNEFGAYDGDAKSPPVKQQKVAKKAKVTTILDELDDDEIPF